MCAFSSAWKGAGSSLRELSPPPQPTAGRELGGDRYHPRVGQEKPSHLFAPFQHLSTPAGGEAMRGSSPGSIPAGREGEREKLSDSGMCSLLCHLLLARVCPGHHTGLVEKAQPGANPPCSQLLRTIFRIFFFGKERGVIGCYQDKNM